MALGNLLGGKLDFVDDCIGEPVQRGLARLRPGEAMLLENTRFHTAEEENDPDFSRQLPTGKEIYVDDSFGWMHRAHAYTAGIVGHFREKGVGHLVSAELKALAPLLEGPARPFILILGGAKVSDKIGIIRNLLARIDRLLIGGGMAFSFLKAKGVAIGRSL